MTAGGWRGMATYLTGGTTQTPRSIEYTCERWEASTRITAAVLRAHGVGPRGRVLIGHPFEPWAIGGIFRDAALACGASVLPLGLTFRDAAMASAIRAFSPTALCCSASLISGRFDALLSKIAGEKTVVFHAGELLQRRTAVQLAARYRVVNVYGMAEFDTVAAQGTSTESFFDLVLSPHFTFAIAPISGSMDRPMRLRSGISGTLLIRRKGARAWHATGDVVRVVGRSGNQVRLWPGQYVVEILGRADDRLKLPDGSTVTAVQINAALRAAGEQCEWQACLYRSSAKVRLVVHIDHSGTGFKRRLSLVRASLFDRCIELGDAVRHHVVRLSVTADPNWRFVRTSRGKIKRLVDMSQ